MQQAPAHAPSHIAQYSPCCHVMVSRGPDCANTSYIDMCVRVTLMQIEHDDSVLLLNDNQPKGRYHALVLPRHPHLHDLSCLRREHLPVFELTIARGQAWACSHAEDIGPVRLPHVTCARLYCGQLGYVLLEIYASTSHSLVHSIGKQGYTQQCTGVLSHGAFRQYTDLQCHQFACCSVSVGFPNSRYGRSWMQCCFHIFVKGWMSCAGGSCDGLPLGANVQAAAHACHQQRFRW
jgi:hypothetical protein